MKAYISKEDTYNEQVFIPSLRLVVWTKSIHYVIDCRVVINKLQRKVEI